MLSPEGQALAAQLANVIAQRVMHETHGSGAVNAPGASGLYRAGGSQEPETVAQTDTLAPDPDALAVAIRERLVRHALDSIAANLLPKALDTLGRVMDGTHPDSRGATQAVRFVFEPLRMVGAHILDRDRTRGADALTVSELEDEIARASAALRRKLAPYVVATVPASSSSPEAGADAAGNTA